MARRFPQGLLVNVIKENILQAIENFGDRKQHISSALQNIGKLKPSNVFTLGVKNDAIDTYAKYKIDGEYKQEDKGSNVDGAKQVDDSKVEEKSTEEKTNDQQIEDGVNLNDLDGVDYKPEEVESNIPEPIEEETIEEETIEEIKGEVIEEVEVKVDKKIKKIASEGGVDLNIGNTVYTLDGELVSFVLTKPTITKNEFVDKSYKSGDLFVLENQIKL